MTSEKEMKERMRDWEDAYSSLDNALSQFEQRECEPDPYQYADLVYSLSAFSNGLYGISAIKADDALIPASDRSPISKPPQDAASKLTITELRAELEEISKAADNTGRAANRLRFEGSLTRCLAIRLLTNRLGEIGL